MTVVMFMVLILACAALAARWAWRAKHDDDAERDDDILDRDIAAAREHWSQWRQRRNHAGGKPRSAP